MDGRSGLQGFIDGSGRLIGDIRWRKINRYHWGLAAVQDPATGLWGYIDKTGAIVIQPQFTSAGSFSGERAVVSTPDSNNRLGLIDETGALIVPAIWRGLKGFYGNFLAVTADDGAIGLVDHTGRIVIEPYHPTPAELERIEETRHFIREHPFSVRLAKELRARVEAALAGSDTLAPVAGMLTPRAVGNIELEAAGLWFRRVTVTTDFVTSGLRIHVKPGDTGYIGWHYPVNATLFDLTMEAPVQGLRALPNGCVGIPWSVLRLADEAKHPPTQPGV